MVPRHGGTGWSVERLTDRTLGGIVHWARGKGLLLFIDTRGALCIYPKTNPAWHQLQTMLNGQHPEMKMFLIRNMLEVSDEHTA
jgi:hypothetical protein